MSVTGFHGPAVWNVVFSPGRVSVLRTSCARSNKHTFESVSLKVGYRESLSYHTVLNELYAHLFEVVYFNIDDGVGKTEFGDAIFEYTANLMQRLEYGYIVSCLCHVSCERKSCGT